MEIRRCSFSFLELTSAAVLFPSLLEINVACNEILFFKILGHLDQNTTMILSE
jgi:hypothetical protein